ncbi:MAG: DUF1273 domain-containing protein [Muribaculaceae bacterium]|nr:DUF1273 domain-containing protein [Muribaculaceae bacterium]
MGDMNNNRLLTAAVTGHRPDKLFGYDLMDPRYTAIRNAIRGILEREESTAVWTGMALGTDMLAALAAIDMQDGGSGIKLLAAIPFRGHKSPKWPKLTQDLYEAILYRSAETHLVTDAGFSIKALDDRNKYMCDRADYLIAVSAGTKGGTENCMKYARRIGLPIWHIDPSDPGRPFFEPGARQKQERA